MDICSNSSLSLIRDARKNSECLCVRYRTKMKFCPLTARVGEKATMKGTNVTDRRIERTQKLLRDALHSLIREKDFDSIVVKEILDRANVGRSTFYTHFRDKEELLVSGIHDILRSVPSMPIEAEGKEHERVLWFSLPIFEYHDRHRRAGEIMIGARGRILLHKHLQKILAELIARDFRRIFRNKRKAPNAIPAEVLIEYLAATFVLVLNWWLENKSTLTARQVNNLFRALVLPTLAANWV